MIFIYSFFHRKETSSKKLRKTKYFDTWQFFQQKETLKQNKTKTTATQNKTVNKKIKTILIKSPMQVATCFQSILAYIYHDLYKLRNN